MADEEPHEDLVKRLGEAAGAKSPNFASLCREATNDHLLSAIARYGTTNRYLAEIFRAALEMRLAELQLEQTERLERATTNLARKSLWAAWILGLLAIVAALLSR